MNNHPDRDPKHDLFVSTFARANLRLVGICFLLLSAIGCSSRVAEKKAYSVARVDTIHGISYPYEFSRARDLIDNGLYEAAAYDYVMLYPQDRDSTVHECLRMDSTLQVTHVKHSIVYYIDQCLVGEAMDDPVVRQDSIIDNKEVQKRYRYAGALLDDLAEYGIK